MHDGRLAGETQLERQKAESGSDDRLTRPHCRVAEPDEIREITEHAARDEAEHGAPVQRLARAHEQPAGDGEQHEVPEDVEVVDALRDVVDRPKTAECENSVPPIAADVRPSREFLVFRPTSVIGFLTDQTALSGHGHLPRAVTLCVNH